MDILRNTLNMFIPPTKQPVKEEDRTVIIDRSEVPPNRQVLLSWEAPTRVFKPRTPEYFKKLINIVLALGIVLVLAGQFFLLILVVCIVVLYYVLSSVPPEKTTHEIDNYRIYYLGKQYYWKEFKYYFLTNESGIDVLNVDTHDPLPGRLILLLNGVSADKAKEVLGRFLPFQKDPPRPMMDTAFKKIAGKLSLE